MADGLDLPVVTVTIRNHFEGPNFVNGLAKQNDSYTVISDTRARLEFVGGFNDTITYVQILSGTGFGVDADGRFTGTVTSYRAFEKGAPENGWSFENLGVALDRLNNLVSDPAVTFRDLLLIPLVYNFVGAQFDDIYIAGSFNDVCTGYRGNDTFQGLSGDDTLFGNSGSDTLTGEDGVDHLDGGSGDDLLVGGRGGDELIGSSGNDVLLGGSEGDTLYGGYGADELDGENGEDVLIGHRGNDDIDGGGGADSIAGGIGADTIRGDTGGDTVKGGAGNDVILGGDGTNVLYGDAGNDRVVGDTGSDQLFGGAGNDNIAAGKGADFVVGGAGNDTLAANAGGTGAGDVAVDTFIFSGAFGRDVVTDFEVGFDNIVLGGRIDPSEVTTRIVGDDVRITVAAPFGTQTIRVEGVAATFDPDVDIVFA